MSYSDPWSTELNQANNYKYTSQEVIDLEVVQGRGRAANSVYPNYNNTANGNTSKPNLRNLKRIKKKKGGKFAFLLVFFLIPLVGVLSAIAVFGYTSWSQVSEVFGVGRIDMNLWQWNPFASTEDNLSQLKGAEEGRINLLLVGFGGVGHQGSFLTDTQIIVSIFPKENRIYMTNIPRDLYVKKPNGQYGKINSIFQDAESQQKNTGASSLAGFLEKELNTEIHYWATIDFAGFEKLVDAVGGIRVDVPRSFVDYEYPNQNYGYLYPAPSFTQGWTTMDGETALIYARSRHGTNGEGSDFARSRRQTQVISAIVDKASSTNVLTDTSKLDAILEAINQNFATSLLLNETYILAKAAQENDWSENIDHWNLSTDSTAFICPNNSPETGYIIIYCDGSYPGTETLSTNRNQFRKQFADINLTVLAEEFENSTIGIVSNGSRQTFNTVLNELYTIKTNGIKYNNFFSEINLTEQPKISLYTQGDQKDLVDYLIQQELDFQFENKGQLPSEITLPASLVEAELIFWIE